MQEYSKFICAWSAGLRFEGTSRRTEKWHVLLGDPFTLLLCRDSKTVGVAVIIGNEELSLSIVPDFYS